MKPTQLCLVLLLLTITLTLAACGTLRTPARAVTSPDGRLELTFLLRNGVPYYRVRRDGAEIIKPSQLGFTFKEAVPLNQNFSIATVRHVATTKPGSNPGARSERFAIITMNCK